tara:strand:- start:4255 stop:5316 length:1062 start_codon:yes stop_codon:yes gene_type:complete
MKFIKYFLISLILLGGLFFGILQIAGVQDFLAKKTIERQFQQANLFSDEDALSAVVCGSRSPFPDPDRAEACILIKAGSDFYVIDIGAGSAMNLQMWPIDLSKLKGVFLSHLHSDHMSDLPGLHFNSWLAGRPSKLKVYGPEGIENLTQGFEQAYALDTKFRVEHHGEEILPLSVAGYDPITLNSEGEIIIDDGNLKVTAFSVIHEPIDPAFGYRFDYKGRSIVISGDTLYSKNLVNNSKRVDVLFHDAISLDTVHIMREVAFEQNNKTITKVLDDIQTYHENTIRVAELANEIEAGYLIYYHLIPSPRSYLAEMLWTRGVNDVRSSNWMLSEDGTLVTLPVGTDEIILSTID